MSNDLAQFSCAELFHDCGNVVFLKQAYARDAGGSGLEAGIGIGDSDPAKGQDWNFGFASFLKKIEARRVRVFLFEHWSENGEGCAVAGGFGYFFWRVTGDSDQQSSW